MSKFRIPEDFLWGGAISAYREKGRGISNIDLIPHGISRMDVKLGKVPNPVLDKNAYYPSHEAIDFYHHYKEDLALMGELGLKVFRTSISWSRLFPRGDEEQPNLEGIAFYRNVFKECRKYGMEPLVTLCHFDIPEGLIRTYGSWRSRKVIDCFIRYAKVCFREFSGLVKYWGISEEQRKTMEGVDNLKCAEIENPFEPGEKLLAVPVPKLDCAIIHVQQASPDGTCIIEGDEFHDIDIAIAAKRTIVTCEEIVSDEYIRRDPTKTRIFGECVNAVVRAPYGAWPSQCYNYYDNDSHALKEYDKASKYQDAEDAKAQLAKAAAKAEKAAAAQPDDAKLAEAAAKAKKAAEAAAAGVAIPETFKDYLEKWVYSVKDNEELLDKVGGSRLMRLKNEPPLGYSTRH